MSRCEYEYEYAYPASVPEVFSEAQMTAAHERECCECGRAMEPGYRYLFSTGRWDGVWQTYRTCQNCQRLRTTLCSYVFTRVIEELTEYS